MYPPNLKSVALPVPEIRGVAKLQIPSFWEGETVGGPGWYRSKELASRSQDIQNGGGVIGPRDNVFPGPAVALDGPGSVCTKHYLFTEQQTSLYFKDKSILLAINC